MTKPIFTEAQIANAEMGLLNLEALLEYMKDTRFPDDDAPWLEVASMIEDNRYVLEWMRIAQWD